MPAETDKKYIILTPSEIDFFGKWLEQQFDSAKSMLDQLESMSTSPKIIEFWKMKTMAYKLVARELKVMES